MAANSNWKKYGQQGWTSPKDAKNIKKTKPDLVKEMYKEFKKLLENEQLDENDEWNEYYKTMYPDDWE